MTNTHPTQITEPILEPLTYDHMAIVQDAQGHIIADCAIIPGCDGFTPTQEQEVAIARRFCAGVNGCIGIPTEALEDGVVRKLAEALKEALAEIEYQHGDMLTEHERNHPRGSGWARVYDKGIAAVSKAGAIAPPPEQPAALARPDQRRLSEISHEHLGIPTLDTQGSDALDFHDVAVWQVKAALQAAFTAGVMSAGTNHMTD